MQSSNSSILHKMIQVAQAKRDFELKKATYDTEVRPLFFSTVHLNPKIIIPTWWFWTAGEHGQGRGRDGLPAAGFQGERQDQGGGDAGKP